jgi:hypothetical protein
MAQIGRTFTERFRVETRQHKLLGLDLGEGPRRRDLIIALVAVGIWLLITIPILQVPNKFTFSLYLIPPALLVGFGIQPSVAQPLRRIRLFDWTRRIHYGFVGSAPVINTGRRLPRRGEHLPLRIRTHWREVKRTLWPFGVRPEWENDEDEGHETAPPQKAQRVRFRTKLYGNDELRKIWASTVGRKGNHQ